MKINHILFLFLLLVAATAATAQQDQTLTITSSGIERTVLVHYPGPMIPETSTGLLLSFHGSGGTSNGQKLTDNFSLLADKFGFIVAYPQALEIGGTLQWNVYVDDKPGHAGVSDATAPDDIQFTKDIIAKIKSLAPIDSKRIFATGLSNGAFMCYALSMFDADEIAAIAPMAGNLWGDDNYLAALIASGTVKPIPVMHIHGTADNVVDYPDLDNTPNDYGEYPLFVAARGCGATTYSSVIPISQNVDKLVFCPPPVEVSLIRITGMAHAWSNIFYQTSDSIVSFFHLDAGPSSVVEENTSLVHFTSTVVDASLTLTIDEPSTIEIISLLGNVIQHSSALAGTTKLPLTDVPDGVYVVKVQPHNGIAMVKKILILH